MITSVEFGAFATITRRHTGFFGDMPDVRTVSAARKRKLRKRGERVWWCHYRWVWVWDMAASRRERPSRKGRAP